GVATIQYAVVNDDPQASEQIGKDLHDNLLASYEQKSQSWDHPLHSQVTNHEGVSIYTLTNGQYALSYGFSPERLVISGNPDAIYHLLKGQPISSQSLMQNFKYQQYLNSLNSDTYISLFFDTEAYYNDLTERLHFKLLGDAERALVEFLNLNRTSSLSLGLGLEGGQFTMRSNLKFKGARTGFYTFFGSNRDFESLRLAPENSRAVMAASLQPMAQFYDSLLNFLRGILDPSQQQMVGMTLGMAEGSLGLSIRNDLFANIGPEAAIIFVPSPQGGLVSDPILLLKINETAAMDAVLGKLIAAQQGSMGLKSEDLSFQGQNYHHLQVPSGKGVFLGYLRSFLIVSPSEQAYQAVIEASSSGKNVTTSAAFQQFFSSFPRQQVVMIYSLSSPEELKLGIQSLMGGWIAARASGQSSFDPAAFEQKMKSFGQQALQLKPSELLPSGYAMVETSDGLEAYSRSKCFYTPDILALTGLGTTLVTPVIVGTMVEQKTYRVQREMITIRSGMERFLSDRGAYPANLNDLLGPQVRYVQELKPDPFSAGGTSPYSYVKDDRARKWAVLSPGPNGTFDITQDDLNFTNPGYYLQLISKTYDPTNGVFSSGDIVVFKP
ncbi:MAG: DUF3352 domain-containing protein, partial [bacterium]